MGFFSKKSLPVSLLALSLAACTSVSNPPPPKATDTPINLPCDGDDTQKHEIQKTRQTIVFQTSGCNLFDVKFTKNGGGFKKSSPPTDPKGGVRYDYDGSLIPDDGAAHFYYFTDYIPRGSSTDGGGNGVIRSK